MLEKLINERPCSPQIFLKLIFFGWDANGVQSNVFIIDRGILTHSGGARGWKKVQIKKSDNGYVVHSADLDGANEAEFEIEKSSDYNFKYTHFDNGEVDIDYFLSHLTGI